MKNNSCQHCGQGALARDDLGPVCPDCWEEGRFEDSRPDDECGPRPSKAIYGKVEIYPKGRK